MSTEARLSALEAALATLAEGMATLVARTAAPAASAPARSQERKSVDGRDFPCTATPACAAFTRSAKSAASHDSATGHWHSVHTPAQWATACALREQRRAK
jgi:hypothetical protein